MDEKQKKDCSSRGRRIHLVSGFLGVDYRRPASIETFLRRLVSVLMMATGVYKPHFVASSLHRTTFTGVSRPSFFRV